MLDIRDISKSYGSHRVLDGVSLSVHPGEVLGYVGGNGAGKTTSMRIMLGVATADSGAVTFQGRPIDATTRARVGYMPEERGLYPGMRIQPQLEFFAQLRGISRSRSTAVADYWLERLGLTGRRDSRLEDLSLGNQQRIQLAVALLHEPELLVLDEPFSGLDPLAVDMMAAILREEADRGVPVIFSSHQLDLVEQVCDRVAILSGGRVIADGSVEELAGGRGRYLVRTQEPVEQWRPALRLADGESVRAHESDAAVVQLAGPERLAHLTETLTARTQLLELRPWRPSLTDTYRQAVQADAEAKGDAA